MPGPDQWAVARQLVGAATFAAGAVIDKARLTRLASDDRAGRAKEHHSMANKDKGNLRKRLIPGYQSPSADADPEVSKLAEELAGTVGKTVEKATELGLSVVQDVGLTVMEVFSTPKPTPGRGVMGTAASLFTSTREKAPAFSGQVASKVTGLIVNGGFGVLRAIHETVRNTRRPR
jgi:hypothetical protein